MFKTQKMFWKFLVFAGLGLVTVSCQRADGKRQYEEVVISAPTAPSIDDPHAFMRNMPNMPNVPNMANMPMMDMQKAGGRESPVAWSTPQGWQEQPKSGMRLATFLNTDSAHPIECSIVSLGGGAGGLESNIRRWMGQINLAPVSDDDLSAFISKQEQLKSDGGLDMTVIDFTSLQNDSQADSMTAAILSLSDSRIFVKMTGKKENILKNREQFHSLCKSLKASE